MGGKSKKVTIGFRYYMGLFMGLSRGPVDAMRQIRVGDKLAWTGVADSNQTINIDQPNLFGGDEQEGGIQGSLQLMMGASDQPRNESLTAMLGGLVSAFRGVTTVFFDGLVCAMSPYPKEWSFLVQKTKAGWDKGVPWYPEKCEIPLDSSVTMLGPGWEYVIENFVEPNTVWDNFTPPSGGWIQGGELPFSSDDTWKPLRSNIWLRRQLNVNAVGVTMKIAADNGCAVWINGVLIGKSNPDNENIPYNENYPVVYDFAQTGTIDVLVKAYAEKTAAFESGNVVGITFVDQKLIAMNPAHILRRLYTDPHTGRGFNAALRLDEPSWIAAADTFHAEGFGLCMTWSRTTPVSDFVAEVINHAGAAIYTSRKTGKIVLLPIRGNYNIADLPVFTPDSGLIGFDDDEAATQTTGINEVVVKWTDVQNKREASVREKNLGAIMAAKGVTSTEEIEYLGIASEGLARRVARRDLQARSGFVKRFTLRLDRRGKDLAPGHVFAISDPSRGLDKIVLRAGRVEFGTPTDGTIVVTALLDVFGLPANVYRDPEENAYVPPDTMPRPAPMQDAMEAPYRELVQAMRQADLEILAPEAGFLTTMATRPKGISEAYQLVTRIAPADFAPAVDLAPWAPGAKINTALAADVTPVSVVLSGVSDPQNITVGMAAKIGSEIVRVDSFVSASNTLGIGRGCVDTVPQSHAAGAEIIFYDNWTGDDTREYIAGVSVDAKMLTRTGSGTLSPSDAPTETVVFDSRAARPYPPADVLINGVRQPAGILRNEIDIAWHHRDRITQADTLIDASMPSIGPETGVSYTVRVHLDGTLVDTVSGISGDRLTGYIYAGNGQMRVEVQSVRDGLTSWQSVSSRVFEYSGALELLGTLPAATIGAAYSGSLAANGGVQPYTWSLGTGYPPGLSINTSTGLITGTPTTGGNYTFDVVVTDSASKTASSTQTVPVAAGDQYWANVVLLMHFDGDFVDQRGNTMSAVGTAGFGPGKFGSAMTLTSGNSGTSQPANTSTLDLLADFTIEGWVKPDAGSSGAFLNRFEVSGAGTGWQIYIDTTGQVSFYHYVGSGTSPIGNVGPDLRDGNWHHVAVTRAGTVLRMFVDGVLVGTGASSANYTSTDARLSIGYQVQGAARYPMRGSIDEVRITKGIARYTANFTVPSTAFPSN